MSDNNIDTKSVSCSSMAKQTKCILNDIKCVDSFSIEENSSVLIYDVDANKSDADLNNVMFLRDGWQRHVVYLQEHCSDFNLWKKTDFQFSFVPLSNLVIPDSSGHIGDKVSDPIEQYFAVKSAGLPNF